MDLEMFRPELEALMSLRSRAMSKRVPMPRAYV